MTLRKALWLNALWLVAVALHVALRIVLILCVPILFIWSGFFMAWSQKSAQASFDMSCLFVLRLPPRPPLFRRRRKPTNHGAVAGEILPPLDHEPSDLIRIRGR